MNNSVTHEAQQLYDSIRANDAKLLAVEAKAIVAIRELTGYVAEDVGSFGLLLNLPGSDLDLAIGVPDRDRDRVVAILKSAMKYKGERQTSSKTIRHVFVFTVAGVEVDLGILPTEDFSQLIHGLNRCRTEMTMQERVLHVWEKHTLKLQQRHEDYARLKLEPYARFCPGFIWVPIL
jgi:hypothetical protein